MLANGSEWIHRCFHIDSNLRLNLKMTLLCVYLLLLPRGRAKATQAMAKTTELVNIDIDADERLSIGDFFEQAEAMWEINRIEDKENQSKKSLLASNISRINATRADVLRVRLTLTKGGVSISSHVNVPRDTTFQGGTLYDFAGETWRIRAIHTGEGRTMKGTVAAQNIKRVYLHEVKREEKPRQPRTRRKEGRHGKKADWVTTQTPSKPMSKISLNQSRAGGTRNARKRNEPDHGRLVQGIKNALATCVPMVGFSRNLLIEYSYHFSPYGM